MDFQLHQNMNYLSLHDTTRHLFWLQRAFAEEMFRVSNLYFKQVIF